MGKFNDAHLAKLNPTGIAWADMTDEQRLELRKSWDRIVSDMTMEGAMRRKQKSIDDL